MSAPRKRTSEDPPDVEYIGEEKRCSDSGDGGSHTGSPGIDQGASPIMEETNLGHQDTTEYLETGLLGRKSFKLIAEENKPVVANKFLKESSECGKPLVAAALPRVPAQNNRNGAAAATLFDKLEDLWEVAHELLDDMENTDGNFNVNYHLATHNYVAAVRETVDFAKRARKKGFLQLMVQNLDTLLCNFEEWGNEQDGALPTAGRFALLSSCYGLFTWPSRVGEDDTFQAFFKLLRVKYMELDNITRKGDIQDQKFWVLDETDCIAKIVVLKLGAIGKSFNVQLNHTYIIEYGFVKKIIELKEFRDPTTPCTSRTLDWISYQINMSPDGNFNITRVSC